MTKSYYCEITMYEDVKFLSVKPWVKRLPPRRYRLSIPKPFPFVPTVAMEDLGHMELLGDQLHAGEVDGEALSRLGTLIYQIHRATSKDLVSGEKWNEIVSQFK